MRFFAKACLLSAALTLGAGAALPEAHAAFVAEQITDIVSQPDAAVPSDADNATAPSVSQESDQD